LTFDPAFFSPYLYMTLSVIIPTHKRFFQVSRLMDSLLNQEFPRENLQILLISNLKDKKLKMQCDKWKSCFYDFKYLVVGEKGVNKARNLGIRFAYGDVLYFLDDDCLLPHKTHLHRVLLSHKTYPHIIGIGGRYKNKFKMEGMKSFYYQKAVSWLNQHAIGEKAFQLLGGNASYKREAFDRGFNFDSHIVFGGSEESLNRDLVENNWELMILDQLSVYHIIDMTFWDLINKSFLQGAGSVKNRYDAGQHLHQLSDMKKEAIFSNNHKSFYAFIYDAGFKLGFFWQLSLLKAGQFFIFRFILFVLFILKSRLVVFKEKVVLKVVLKVLGRIWFYVGRIWFYVGRIWFYVGWFYGYILVPLFYRSPLKVLGLIWFYVGLIWFYVGWFYGYILVPLFYRSPFMKIYYFSRYQFYKRIKPLLHKRLSIFKDRL